MKVKIYNEDNLSENEIDETVTRVKVFLIYNHQVLVAYSGGGIQLIGGHVEEGEQMMETVKREVMEEVGIEISSDIIFDPFFEIIYYTKNYKDTGKNRMSIVYYYVVHIEQMPNENKIQLTESEKEKGFHLDWLSLENYEEHVKKFLDDQKEISRNVANEMLLAYQELQDER